ncbi:3'-5' exonuclease domain-containing protein 2 [Massilia sp. TW-1]|uniref:3'-5' exonuclease domain-containing protein 2 n=1 Tax=Telluria antibiotica TaxID=2717319 RepID=A0ABX0PJ84_9BURK|nr:3'-5' exonuclease [Telluria antibiotica]NIA57105.1 3'-5' exonuclease domain-containing protein 2 [Telluria antibiotica]
MSEAEDDLPPYQGIALADVRLVRNRADADGALAALLASDAIGFDTESKPTFQKGEQSTGPHLVQLATDEHAYLFQIGARPARAPDPAEGGTPAPVPGIDVLRAVLESATILKVGFGLGDDLRRLRAKLGIETCNVLDLSTALRRGERNALGAKTAVARFFGQRLQKSRKITTTNWALPRLTDKQILYAADDAHVALRIYRHWRANPPPPLPPKPVAGGPMRAAQPKPRT